MCAYLFVLFHVGINVYTYIFTLVGVARRHHIFYLSIYIYIYIIIIIFCIYIYIYIHIYFYIYIYIYTHTYIFIYIYTHSFSNYIFGNAKQYFQICSYIQKMILHLIKTFKMAMYHTKSTQHTQIHFQTSFLFSMNVYFRKLYIH